MKHLYLFALLLASTSAYAQPTIEYDESHSIGITGVLFLINGSTTALQQTGPDVVWDFSGIPLLSAGSFDIMAPANTPEGANYPDANTCFRQQSGFSPFDYTYVADLPANLHSLATGIGTNDPTDWVVADKLLDYPFNYLDSFESTHQSSTDVPQNFTRTYDAYGTLIINGNTYTDVVRISKTPGYALWFTSSPTWFPIIVQVNEFTFTYNEPDFSGINVESIEANLNLSVYPNPTSQLLNVTVSAEAIGSSYVITDVQGKQVSAGVLSGISTSLDVAHIAAGSYTLALTKGAQRISRGWVKK